MPDVILRGGEANPNDIRLGIPGATSLTPPAGALASLGFAVILALGIIPLAGELTLTGESSSIDNGMTPDTGILATMGFAPSVLTPQSVVPSTGALGFTGYAASLLVPEQITPPPGVLVLGLGGAGAGAGLQQRVVRGRDTAGKDDWWISYHG